jgi:hypothetical protein
MRALLGMRDEIAPDGVGGPQVMGFDPVDTTILAAVMPTAVDLINVTDGKTAALPDTADSTWVAFAPSGALAVVIGVAVRVFPDPLNTPDRSSPVSGIGHVFSVTFSPAGAMAVLRNVQPALTIDPPGKFSAGTVVPLSVPGSPGARVGADNVVFGPRGQLAAVVGTGNSPAGIEIFSPGTYADPGFIPDTTLALATDDELVAFAPDGTLAVGNSADIELYGPGTYQNPRIIAGVHSQDDSGYSWVGGSQYAFAAQLTISPDGRYFAYANAIDYGLGISDNANVVMIWSAPYLDGDVTDACNPYAMDSTARPVRSNGARTSPACRTQRSARPRRVGGSARPTCAV